MFRKDIKFSWLEMYACGGEISWLIGTSCDCIQYNVSWVIQPVVALVGKVWMRGDMIQERIAG